MSKTITITEKKSASSAELFVKALLEQTDQEILLLDPERNVFAASRPAKDAYRIARSATSQRPVQKGEAKPIRLVLSHSPLPPVLPSDELIPVQEGNRRVGYLVIRKKGDGTDFDFLTGVAGRKLLEEEFNHRNRERSKEDRGLVLVFIDLDQFKPVNDKFGHLVGDQVLLQFATLLKNSFRPTDLVARYGGDEFILLCDNCPLTVIRKRIEEFRKNLANRYVAVSFPGSGEEGEKIRLGFSYGMTEVDPGDSFEVAVHNADQGLAQMKKGR